MKYVPESRMTTLGEVWVAVDRKVGVELACWFESKITCEEIGRRTETQDQYITNIPLVPVDSPIPRPHGTQVFHPAQVRKKGLPT